MRMQEILDQGANACRSNQGRATNPYSDMLDRAQWWDGYDSEETVIADETEKTLAVIDLEIVVTYDGVGVAA